MRAGATIHPLVRLFHIRAMDTIEGMNWLQEHGHISDNCVRPEDVAVADVARIEKAFVARWGKNRGGVAA